jgi:hypothetical protein
LFGIKYAKNLSVRSIPQSVQKQAKYNQYPNEVLLRQKKQLTIAVENVGKLPVIMTASAIRQIRNFPCAAIE